MTENNKSDHEIEKAKVIYVAQPSAPGNDEIDLRDLFRTLLRRKLIVIVIALVAVMASLVYIYTSSPVFESSTTLSIGNVTYSSSDKGTEIRYFEKAENLVIYLNTGYQVSASVPNTGYLSITANGKTREDAEQALLTAMNDVLNRHKKIYDVFVESTTKQIELLDNQRDYYFSDVLPKLEIDLESLYILRERRLKDFRGDTNQSVEMGYLLNELISDRESGIKEIERIIIPDLEMKKLQIQEKLYEPQLRKTVMIGKIDTPFKPVEPKKKQILIISIFGGLMLGIFAAFFLEYLKPTKVKNETSGN